MYATPDDLKATFEERDLVAATNLNDPRASEMVADRLLQHCKIATGIVNGYLMQRFTIPLQGASEEFLETLKAHTINLARESLDASSEEVRTKADNSRRWLEGVSQTPSGESNDTTPGVEPTGAIAYFNQAPFWNSENFDRLGW